MERLKALWEYQQVDARLDRINGRLRKSEERKLLSEAKAYILDAKDNMNKIEEQADKLVAEMERLESEQAALNEKLRDLSARISTVAEESEELDKLYREIRKVNDDASGIEKSVRELIATTDNLKKKYSAYASGGSKKRKEYDETKVKYDQLKAAADEEARPIVEKLRELEKNLDPAYLAEYKRIKNNKPNPLAALDGNRCTGCNMELPPKVAKEVAAAEHMVECENCGRILLLI